MKTTNAKFQNSEGYSGDISRSCMRYGVGRYTIEKAAAECGAKIKIGRRAIYNWRKLDAFFDANSGV